MSSENSRDSDRIDTFEIKAGLMKAKSLFIGKPEISNVYIADLSEIGFQAISSIKANKGDKFDFLIVLPFFGELNGRATVQWVGDRLPDSQRHQVGFKFGRLKKGVADKLKEVSSSPEIIKKMYDERERRDDPAARRWDNKP